MKYRNCIGTNAIEIKCKNDDSVGIHREMKREGILALYRDVVDDNDDDEVVEIADNKVEEENTNSIVRKVSLNAFSSSANTCYSSTYTHSFEERKVENEEDNSVLCLLITDGSETFHGR